MLQPLLVIDPKNRADDRGRHHLNLAAERLHDARQVRPAGHGLEDLLLHQVQAPRGGAAHLDLGERLPGLDEATDLQLDKLVAFRRPTFLDMDDQGRAVRLDPTPNIGPAAGIDVRPEVRRRSLSEISGQPADVAKLRRPAAQLPQLVEEGCGRMWRVLLFQNIFARDHANGLACRIRFTHRRTIRSQVPLKNRLRNQLSLSQQNAGCSAAIFGARLASTRFKAPHAAHVRIAAAQRGRDRQVVGPRRAA